MKEKVGRVFKKKKESTFDSPTWDRTVSETFVIRSDKTQPENGTSSNHDLIKPARNRRKRKKKERENRPVGMICLTTRDEPKQLVGRAEVPLIPRGAVWKCDNAARVQDCADQAGSHSTNRARPRYTLPDWSVPTQRHLWSVCNTTIAPGRNSLFAFFECWLF